MKLECSRLKINKINTQMVKIIIFFYQLDAQILYFNTFIMFLS